jgi:hypothetical protein
MKRRLLNLLTALSLLLCVAAVALWVRSYWRFDDVVYVGHFRVNNFCSYRGRFFAQLGWSRTDVRARSAPPYNAGGWFRDSRDIRRVAGYPAAQRSRGWRLGGFDARRHFSETVDAAGRPDRGEDVMIVPYWFLCMVALAAPLQWARRHRPWRSRLKAGLCPTCGYDLRATPGRCPECGAKAATAGNPSEV